MSEPEQQSPEITEQSPPSIIDTLKEDKYALVAAACGVVLATEAIVHLIG